MNWKKARKIVGKEVAEKIERFAEEEGLEAHANSIRERFK